MPVVAQPELESPERFRNYLLLLARGKIGPKYRAKIDAESLVNQVLFEAHQQRNQIRGCSDAELIGWLRKVLFNLVDDAIRHHHRDLRNIDRELRQAGSDWDQSCSRFLDVTCGYTSPSIQVVRHERELQLASALAALPDQQREAVELRHLHGCKAAEIAQILDCSLGAVAGLLRRGLKRLKELLHKPDADSP